MGIFTILATALALAMDAFAVSVANGIAAKKASCSLALRFGFAFGLAQMIMPVIGFFLAYSFSDLIESFDHWAAFALLAFIGGKMIFESFKTDNKEEKNSGVSAAMLLTLAIATSIDAMAVGVSIGLLKGDIIPAALAIGLITFCLSFAGVLFGSRIGGRFKKYAELAGGSALIVIGLKILLEHLLA